MMPSSSTKRSEKEEQGYSRGRFDGFLDPVQESMVDALVLGADQEQRVSLVLGVEATVDGVHLTVTALEGELPVGGGDVVVGPVGVDVVDTDEGVTGKTALGLGFEVAPVVTCVVIGGVGLVDLQVTAVGVAEVDHAALLIDLPALGDVEGESALVLVVVEEVPLFLFVLLVLVAFL